MYFGKVYLGAFKREDCTQKFPEEDVISTFIASPWETRKKVLENLNLLQICDTSGVLMWSGENEQ